MKKNDNPALREAAKEFNDSLLGAQKKKIDHLLELDKIHEETIKGMQKEIDDFYNKCEALKKIVESRNNDIEKLTKERNLLQDKYDAMGEEFVLDNNKIVRMGKEISRLNGIIHKKNKLVSDKDAVLSDVAEECRLSKIREEKLTEVCKKYLKEIDDLKKKEARLIGIINKNDKVIGNLNHELCKVYKKYASLHKECGELESKLSEAKKPKSPCVRKVHPELIIPHNDFMQIIRIW